MEKIIFCDLDNTLLDTLTELEKLVPGYKTHEQYEYVLKDRFLEPFLNGSVYDNVKFNFEVISRLKQYHSNGWQLIFISQTFTKTAADKKKQLISQLEKDFNDSFKLYLDDMEITEKLLSYKEQHPSGIMFFDDAPSRLEFFQKHFPYSRVYKVTYPYNTKYKGCENIYNNGGKNG